MCLDVVCNRRKAWPLFFYIFFLEKGLWNLKSIKFVETRRGTSLQILRFLREKNTP